MNLMAAAGPFDHVLDTQHWHFFESLHLDFHLPAFLTKYMVLMLIAAGLIMAIYIPLARRVQSGVPVKGRFWNAFESILTFLRNEVAKPSIGKDADNYVPFIWTTFLFILFCNLLGMIPYMGSPTASFTVTLTLAAVTFVVIHGSAIAEMGLISYLKSYIPHIDVPVAIGAFLIPMIVVIEIMGNFIKAFVLAVRLFANMFAGHTVLSVMLLFIVMVRDQGALLFWPITITSVLGVVALSLLELFVAFLQAFIFTFLASLFIGSALHPEH